MGGPVFSALGLLLSLVWRALSPQKSVSRELADMACLSHGFIFAGSLLPLPFVDGGTILKWAMVKRRQTARTEDRVVQEVVN